MTIPRDKLKKILPILGLLAVAAFILRGPLFFGKSILVVDIARYAPWGDGKGVYKDNSSCTYQPFFIYPAKTLYKQYVSKGQLPGWEPKLMAGYPIEGDPMYGWFDPFNLIFLVFSVETGLKLLALIQLFLIGLFSYGFLRQVGLKQISSFFGGTVSLASMFFLQIPNQPVIQSVIWFPFLLWMFERMYAKCKAWPYIGLMSMGVALSILGGEIGLSICILIGFFLYASGRILFPGAWECLESKPKLFGNVLLALLLGIFVTAPQVLPTLRLSLHSYYDFKFFGSHMKLGVYNIVGLTMFFPLFAIRFRYKDRRVLMLILLAILSLYLFGTLIPAPSNGRAYIFGTSVTLLAGFGFEELISDYSRKRQRFAFWVAVLLILEAIYSEFIFAPLNSINLWPILDYAIIFCERISAVISIVLIARLREKRWIFIGLLIMLVLYSPIYLLTWYLRFQKQSYLQTPPSTITWLQKGTEEGRIARFGETQVFLPNTPLMYGIKDSQAQAKFQIEGIWVYWSAIDPSTCACQIDIKPLRKPETLCSSLINAFGIRYILSSEKLPADAGDSCWNLVYRDKLWIYENKKAYPHSWVVPSAKFFVKKNEEKFSDEIFEISTWSNENFDPSEEVTIEGKELGFLKGGKGTVKEQRPSNDVMKFEVDAPEGGWLVVSETYYPGWEAEDHGEPTRIYKADVAFMAVPLKPGLHYVIFTYRSTMRKIGYYFAGLAGYILLMGMLYSLRGRKRGAVSPGLKSGA